MISTDIDEAQNLPEEFFRDFCSFVNFAFDSRDLMTVWLVGHPHLGQILARASNAALATRVHVRVHLKAISERERFAALIQHAFKTAGAQHTLLAESGLELLRQASQGLPRQAARILRTAMQIAASKKLNICRTMCSNRPLRSCDERQSPPHTRRLSVDAPPRYSMCLRGHASSLG